MTENNTPPTDEQLAEWERVEASLPDAPWELFAFIGEQGLNRVRVSTGKDRVGREVYKEIKPEGDTLRGIVTIRNAFRTLLAEVRRRRATELRREDIFAAAEQAGFVRTESCCGVESKLCDSDEWRGNLEGFANALLRIVSGRNK